MASRGQLALRNLQSLATRNRRTARIDLGADVAGGLARLWAMV